MAFTMSGLLISIGTLAQIVALNKKWKTDPIEDKRFAKR